MCFLLCVLGRSLFSLLFFFNDTATTEIYTLSLHDALPISSGSAYFEARMAHFMSYGRAMGLFAVVVLLKCAIRSEEHTSELQSHLNLVCRLLLEKKKKKKKY